MTDCTPFSLNPFVNHPWPYALLMTLMNVALLVVFVWVMWDSRRQRREHEAREAIRHEQWAARNPAGYAAAVQQRADEDALVAARLAQRPSWWWRRRI